ncbi:acetyltransferase-like protein [Dendryphion nanum]|uniref:Acetyltransferase-like protein n=1 Tax=Dendryphion nanum TaxID=256645 RepID=A0A9P9DSX5_9PLEO|nr:acetyltransferase-like protein [Dendryphion nanum]
MSPTFPTIHRRDEEICIQELSSIPLKDRLICLQKVHKIEKKSFPSSEAFDFETELKKKNTTLILVTKPDASINVIGYLVFLRIKRTALLHKICLTEQERGRGVGKILMLSVRTYLEKGGCDNIQLWVDEARTPAKALYQSCGFGEIDQCADYYGPGRTALKMQLLIHG